MPAIKTYREAVFSGWFGPMGVGAVFLSMVAKEQLTEVYKDEETPPVAIELISPVVLFIVLSSTLVHGTTIPLFKIGNRIRTRTLSIASTGSGQVLRLPKIQFGQQMSFGRKSEENIQQPPDDKEPMSQLKRNTLMNTMQPQQPAYTIQMQDDEDNLAEEDFLPDESDGTEVGTDLAPTANDGRQRASAQEPQSIRFLEPFNPRASNAHSGTAASNIEKNDASVSSLKSWMNRNKTEQQAQTEESNNNQGGLRNLFRRHKEPAGPKEEALPEKQNTSNAMNTLYELFATHESKPEEMDIDISHLSSDIEIWNETNHVVIENKNDAASQTVFDKSDPEWLNKVKEKVKELQLSIDEENKSL